MNRDDFERLTHPAKPDTSFDVYRDYFTPLTLPSTEQRTLLYGYNVERETFHVYLVNDEIHRIIYTSRGIVTHSHGQRWDDVADLTPNKRIYPERTEAAFAERLRWRGAYLSFTNWTRPEPDDATPLHRGTFHGLTHFDFEE